jgi:hypothetical protein
MPKSQNNVRSKGRDSELSHQMPTYCSDLDADCPLDRWISYAVKVLRDGGIETYESCEGGEGHSFRDPTVRFHGTRSDGFRALAIAQTVGLPVRALRRFWDINDGEPAGPYWELTFFRRSLIWLQRDAERTGRIA